MILKGYYVKYGYMGWVPELNRYLLFCSDTEYLECVDNTGRISLAPVTESALTPNYITESALTPNYITESALTPNYITESAV